MNLTSQQLADILAGITRSQQAIIDAIDRANPGWRNTYLLPTLTVAANQRLAAVRLLDLPARILLRSQGRNPMDQAAVERSLNEALGLSGSVSAAPVAAPIAAASPPTPASKPAAAPGSDDLSNFFDT